MSNLEVHHKEFRSQSGDDSEPNLITLCTACHATVHRSRAFEESAVMIAGDSPQPSLHPFHEKKAGPAGPAVIVKPTYAFLIFLS